MKEAELFAAHANPDRSIRCVCRGWLSAPPNDELMIRLEVERHQRTAQHREWWKRVGNLWQ